MRTYWLISVLLACSTSTVAQVSTQYLDFGPLGTAMLSTQDGLGNAYVVGVTDKYADIVAYKLAPSGAVLYRFALGSTGYNQPTGIALDRDGSLYVAGETLGNIPIVRPILDYDPSGSYRGFVCKIDPSGTQLLFSTLLGGKAPQRLTAAKAGAGVGGIALDPAGNVYVAGWTTSPDFPITPGAFHTQGPDTGNSPSMHEEVLVPSAFVMKIASTLDKIVYSTFLSGLPNYGSEVRFIAVDGNGIATVSGVESDAGVTQFGPNNFPPTPGAYQQNAYGTEGFATRLSADGSSLIWSAEGIGGGGMDPSGYLLAWGQASATFFRTLPGALQADAPAGTIAGVLQRLAADGSGITAATFLGTATIASLNFDSQGNIWVAGSCGSSGLLDIPATTQPASAFFAEISPDLDRLIQAHLMPGDQAIAALPRSDGSVALVGSRGAFWLLPAGFESGPAVLDVANSAASVYWGYVGDGPTGSSLIGSAAWQYVSPGALVSIYGVNLGPSALTATFDRPGHIATSLGGVTVTFNGTRAPLLYAGPGQINAIVPFETAGQNFIVMRVETASGFSQSLGLPVLPATPFVFGTIAFGQFAPYFYGPFAASLNQDGTPNSADNPAQAGSIVTIFANGAGIYTQSLEDGSVAGTNPTSPTATIAIYDLQHSVYQKVLYAGTAPGLVAGALQVNFQLPSTKWPEDQFILVVGDSYSQPFNIYVAQ